MIILKYVLKFIKILNSEVKPWQIGMGIAIGVIMGLTPFLSFHNLLLFCVLAVVRVNVTSALVSLGVFSGVSSFTGEFSNTIGLALLNRPAFEGFWRVFSETPVLALLGLNNTLLLGSICIGIPAAAVFFWLGILFIKYYRHSLKEHIEQWKIIRYLKMTKIVKLYRKVNRMT